MRQEASKMIRQCLRKFPWKADRMTHLVCSGSCLKQMTRDKPIGYKHYIGRHGGDMPEIRNWKCRAIKGAPNGYSV